jgi:pSer/pThr/pTyr-binding forkhead associated (FHA) protein
MNAKVPRLIFLDQGGRTGRARELSGNYLTVGRSSGSDVLLPDLSVSRVHAAIRIDDNGCVLVKDLGSTAGTRVNGRLITKSTALQSGDVVAFGGVRFECDGMNGYPDATAPLPTQRAAQDSGRPVETHARYDIESQHGSSISNVAGDQYTSYVQHVSRERDSFLREIAATKTRARWLIWAGAALSVIGLILFGGSLLQFMNFVFDMIKSTPTSSRMPSVPGLNPLAFVGFAMCAAGNILMIVGVVLHVVATSRRKRVDRELPPRSRAY